MYVKAYFTFIRELGVGIRISTVRPIIMTLH